LFTHLHVITKLYNSLSPAEHTHTHKDILKIVLTIFVHKIKGQWGLKQHWSPLVPSLYRQKKQSVKESHRDLKQNEG